MDEGYVDMHLHYLPGVDDGVREASQGIALCQGLRRLGFTKTVATPHIRTAMFENRRSTLRPAFEAFETAARDAEDMPELDLAAEHFCDDVFWRLFQEGETVAYPGGHAALIEFPEAIIPLGVEQRFFEMRVQGVAPVLAHPERYRPIFAKSDALQPLLDAGLMLQLDLMSLVGRYGRRPRRAAERLLAEDAYFLACSDSHRPDDVPVVATALDRLFDLAGSEYAQRLLGDNPRRVLSGEVDL
ncbi:MAG: protein tyrosine phosphatase [Myxococcales bacterium]|nr:protein tyrosine phosphatase [Myxococcales bacterium]MDD9964819.1 protein tyrosine phosphatase [Myxococcales bacterium]